MLYADHTDLKYASNAIKDRRLFIKSTKEYLFNIYLKPINALSPQSNIHPANAESKYN